MSLQKDQGLTAGPCQCTTLLCTRTYATLDTHRPSVGFIVFVPPYHVALYGRCTCKALPGTKRPLPISSHALMIFAAFNRLMCKSLAAMASRRHLFIGLDAPSLRAQLLGLNTNSSSLSSLLSFSVFFFR